MGNLFKQAVVVCAATLSFGAGAYVIGSFVDYRLTDKVKSVISTSASQPSAPAVADE